MSSASTHGPTTAGPSLVASISNDAALELVFQAGDVGLDAAITSGFLDGVPILGLISGGVKAGKQIRDHLYVMKIANFLSQLQGTTHTQRQKFVDRLNSEKELSRFGETVLLLLDQSDDSVKSVLIGRIIAAHILGNISYQNSMRLSAMINRAYASDFSYLKSFMPGLQSSPEIAQGLENAGFISLNGLDAGNIDLPMNSGPHYKINKFGELLVQYGLN